VKWFSQEKGYGFITPDEGGEDIFVHYTGIAGSGFRTLEEGERVSYEPTRGRKGEQAAGGRLQGARLVAKGVRRIGKDGRGPLASSFR